MIADLDFNLNSKKWKGKYD